MTKASSPIRLQQALMQTAESFAKRFHRSTAEQIEYWADIGRSVSTILDPDVVLSIKSGLSRLKVEPVCCAPIDLDAVFSQLESQRESQTLQASLSTSIVRYQASVIHPSWLERIDQNRKVTVGQFTPMETESS